MAWDWKYPLTIIQHGDGKWTGITKLKNEITRIYAEILNVQFGANGHKHTGADEDGAKIGTDGLQDSAVGTLQLKDDAITTDKIKDDIMLPSLNNYTGIPKCADIITKGPYVDARAFGVKGDGSQDDTVALQAAINYCQTNKLPLYIPQSANQYLVSSALNITAPLVVIGDGKDKTNFVTTSSDVFHVTSGGVEIRDLSMSHFPRNSTTTNMQIGIKMVGTTGIGELYNNAISNVTIDGFNESIHTEYVWNMLVNNVTTLFCKFGIRNYGLSVNNQIANSHIGAEGSGSVCISFEYNSVDVTEGWMISNSLLASAEKLIFGNNMSHLLISNCILDLCTSIAIFAAQTCLNWQITNNYIAITQDGYGLYFSSCSDSAQDRGHKIIGNTILSYSGGTAGIKFDVDTYTNYSSILGNSFSGFTSCDIFIASTKAPVIITGNNCKSNLTDNIFVSSQAVISGNNGRVHYARANHFSTVGMMKITYDEAIPTSGTWNTGDICYSVVPSAGGYVGWVCVTSGTPGTWRGFGLIQS